MAELAARHIRAPGASLVANFAVYERRKACPQAYAYGSDLAYHRYDGIEQPGKTVTHLGFSAARFV